MLETAAYFEWPASLRKSRSAWIIWRKKTKHSTGESEENTEPYNANTMTSRKEFACLAPDSSYGKRTQLKRKESRQCFCV